jgi:hypothetical protein
MCRGREGVRSTALRMTTARSSTLWVSRYWPGASVRNFCSTTSRAFAAMAGLCARIRTHITAHTTAHAHIHDRTTRDAYTKVVPGGRSFWMSRRSVQSRREENTFQRATRMIGS